MILYYRFSNQRNLKICCKFQTKLTPNFIFLSVPVMYIHSSLN